MSIDWEALLRVVVVSAAAAVVLVVLVALAIMGHSARTGLGTATTRLCLVAAASVLGYGLYVIVT